MKIKITVQTDKIGSKCETEIDIDEEQGSATQEELEEYALEAMFGMIEWNWTKVE